MPHINNVDSNPEIVKYIHAIWRGQGKDLSVCELCDKQLEQDEGQIHHTKYVEATVKDLQWVCQRCNVQPENKNLV